MATNNNFLQPQLPRLNGKNYSQWNIMMKTLFGSQDLWDIVESGYNETVDQTTLSPQQLTNLKESRKKDKKALYFIYQSVDEAIFERISAANTSKEAWDILNTAYKGEEKVKMVRLQALRGEFDLLRMKDGESVEDYFNRVVSISNQLKINGENLTDQRIVEKILRSLTKNYEHVVVAIEESKNLSELSVESLLGSLQSHELRIKQFEKPAEQAFQAQEFHRGGFRGRGRRGNFRGRGRNQSDFYTREKTQVGNSSFQSNHETRPGNQYVRGRGRGQQRGRGRGNYQSQIQSNYCHKFGHLKKDCYSRLKYETEESNFLHENSDSKDEESVLLMFNEQEISTKNIWYIDSGCSHHMTGNKSMLINLDESVQREVKTGDDKRHLVQGCGDIPIQTKQGMKFVRDVYYVSGLKHNLLSVG